MSGIAQLFLSRGIKVSGSDLKAGLTTDELVKQGAQIVIGHAPSNIQGAPSVVYSSAIKQDNPELLEAKRLGLVLLKRAEALAWLMQDKSVITVSGSHGKTTTTSLVSCLLMDAGFYPTAVIGGILGNIKNNACMGKGEFFIAEADESDGSFLYYTPKYSIITNIDHEHLDYYKDFDNLVAAYRDFLNKTLPSGCVFCCADDENLISILKGYKGRHVLFGLHDNADIYAKDCRISGLTTQFDCFYRKDHIGRFCLALGGMHNVSNALSVVAIGLELGLGFEAINKTLSSYKGAGRRIEVKFRDADYLVIDDYAHHPTEIRATLSAVSHLKRQRVVAVFQPHRYSRTQILLEDFAKCFSQADYLLISDIYPASELPIEGINSQLLVRRIKELDKDKDVFFVPKDEIISHLNGIMRPGDLIITLGAGDIIRICDELVEELKNKSKVQ